MIRTGLLLLALACAATSAAGVEVESSREADASPEVEPIASSRFLVKFKSHEYDPTTDRTRFRYRINPEGPTDVVRFVIGYGACGNVAIRLDPDLPKRVVDVRTDYLDPASGIFGVEWTSRLRRWRSTPFTFEIVGDIPLGTVRVAVEEEGRIATGLLPGPNCVPLYPNENDYRSR